MSAALLKLALLASILSPVVLAAPATTHGNTNTNSNTSHGSSNVNTSHGSSNSNTSHGSSTANTSQGSSNVNTSHGSSNVNTSHDSSNSNVNTSHGSSNVNTGHGSTGTSTFNSHGTSNSNTHGTSNFNENSNHEDNNENWHNWEQNWDTGSYIGVCAITLTIIPWVGVDLSPLTFQNNEGWSPNFASAGWLTVTGTAAAGVSLFYTGSHDCNGIQEVYIATAAPSSRKRHDNSDFGEAWYPSYCFSNSGSHPWHIKTDAAFAVASAASTTHSVSELHLYYWSKSGSSTVIRDAYWTPSANHHGGHRKRQHDDHSSTSTHHATSTSTSTHATTSTTSSHATTSTTSSHATTSTTSTAPTTSTHSTSTVTSTSSSSSASSTAGNLNLPVDIPSDFNEDYYGGNGYTTSGTWKAGKLVHVVDTPWTDGLAAISWVNATTGTIGRTIFYIQDGWLKEMSLVDAPNAEWANFGHEGIQLFFTPGDLTATCWTDTNGGCLRLILSIAIGSLTMLSFL